MSRSLVVRDIASVTVRGVGTSGTQGLASTSGQKGRRALGHGGDKVAGDLPHAGLKRGALRGVGAVAGTRGSRRDLDHRQFVLEKSVVGLGGDAAVGVNDNKTILVGLLGVLVDKATRKHAAHLGGVDALDFSKRTGHDFVTAKLGQEHGAGVPGVRLHLLVVARETERRATAPGVVVHAKHVQTLVIGATVKVLSLLQTVGRDVSGRVTNRDETTGLGLDVGLHVTDDGLDVGSGRSRVFVVDDLVSGKEAQQVIVSLECIDSCKHALEVGRVVGVGGGRTVE